MYNTPKVIYNPVDGPIKGVTIMCMETGEIKIDFQHNPHNSQAHHAHAEHKKEDHDKYSAPEANIKPMNTIETQDAGWLQKGVESAKGVYDFAKDNAGLIDTGLTMVGLPPVCSVATNVADNVVGFVKNIWPW